MYWYKAFGEDRFLKLKSMFSEGKVGKKIGEKRIGTAFPRMLRAEPVEQRCASAVRSKSVFVDTQKLTELRSADDMLHHAYRNDA